MFPEVSQSDIPVIDTGQMIEVDRLMMETYRIDLARMMENAGRNLAHLARGYCQVVFGRRRQAQRFLTAHDQINLIFRPHCHKLSAVSYSHARSDAFQLWAAYAAEMTA